MSSPPPDAVGQEPLQGIRRADPAWLSQVLGIRVEGFEADVIGAGRGFVSTTTRLRLRTNPPGCGPVAVVLKSESANPVFQGLSRKLRAFEREVRFYRELAPPLADQLARVHGCSDSDDDHWVLLDDLSDLRPGDQVRGLSHEEVQAVLRRIARVHARYWQDPALTSRPWLPAHTTWFTGDFSAVLPAFERDYALRLGEEAMELIRAAVASNDAIEAALRRRPWTLVHGDLRADNLLFGGSGADPVATILDWQTVTRSLAAIDVVFLIGGSEPVAERSGHLEELLDLWHRELVAAGVSGYGPQEARRDLQLAALRCLNVCLRVYEFLQDPAAPARVALLNDAELQRHAAAALELRAQDALEALGG